MNSQEERERYWQENYSVGIFEIDRQHKHILSLIEMLRDQINNGMAPHGVHAIMKELISYAKEHFKFEEDLMFTYNYKDAVSHRDGHRHFLAQLKSMASEKKASQPMEAKQILRLVENWFVGHIALEDQAYAGFVNTISDQDFQRFLDKRSPTLG